MAVINGIHGGKVDTGRVLTLSHKGLGCKVDVNDEFKDALARRETYGHEDFVMSFPNRNIVYLSFGSTMIVVKYDELFSHVI